MQGINEAMKRLQEVRVNRKLNKGDQFKNPNGVVVTIIDVDEEHLLDGEPQVTYRFEDSKETKCYKQSHRIYRKGELNYDSYIRKNS